MVLIRMVALVALALLMLPPGAHADTIGPFCWTPQGLDSIFRLVFFVDPSNPDVATVAGKERIGMLQEMPVSGAAFRGPVDTNVGMVLTVGQRSGGSTSFVTVEFNTTTLFGSARCEGLDALCTPNTLFVWLPVLCP